MLGTYALNSDTASYNTAIGCYSSVQNISGIFNTSVGWSSLENNITGSSNTAIGTNALYNNISSWNTAVGDSAGINNTTGFSNTTVGYASLQSNVTGYDLTSIGDSADVSTDGLYNSTAIGNKAIITASNEIVLGNSNDSVVVHNRITSDNGYLDLTTGGGGGIPVTPGTGVGLYTPDGYYQLIFDRHNKYIQIQDSLQDVFSLSDGSGDATWGLSEQLETLYKQMLVQDRPVYL